MRITYLHQYFNTPEMAGGTRSYSMARQMAAKGHEVNMVTAWREDDERRDSFETEEGGVRVHWLPVPYSNEMSYGQRIQAFLRFAWGAAHKAASLPSDVIFATSTPLTIVLPGAYAAYRRKVPMVFEVRDLWPDVPVAMGVLRNRLLISAARRLEMFAYNRATRAVALTPTMREFISAKGVPLDKISVVSNGADLERFAYEPSRGRQCADAQVKLSDEPRTLLYCGSLGPAHGPDYLVQLADEFLKQSLNIRIVVVGSGRLRESLEMRARETNCLDRSISFVGDVPPREVPNYYSRADASLMTMAACELLNCHSVQNKFFDSLAAARPVFSNYAGWAPLLAEREGVGLILPREDIAAAARMLAEKVEDRAWLAAAGRSARRLAEERFGYDHLGEQLEAVLVSAVNGS